MEDKKIELTLSLINGILQYLITRPLQEVLPLFQEIQSQATPQLPSTEAKKEPAV